MGISSLGVGSSILTQDVLDQLREVDNAQRVTPIEFKLANENDKQDALEVLDVSMTNLIDSINEVKTASLWDERSATVSSGTSVEVSSIAKTDIQDFTLDVSALATKQIEQSGSFSTKTETIANASGILNLNIDSLDFEIAYDDTTSLDDLRRLINETAGDKVNATIVQVATGDFRLFVSSVDTGDTQNITMTDKIGSGEQLKDAKLTTGVTSIQDGTNAAFTFNGQAISRTSNKVDDLITGLTVTIKETGISEVSIAQDRTGILSKFDSFVEKYNSAVKELDKLTKVSIESDERGIFSNDSTVKNMKRVLNDMVQSVGGSAGSLFNYGFDIDKDGKMSLDKTLLEEKIEANSNNVQAFFSGGDFLNEDATTTSLTGAFTQMSTTIESYTKTNQTLDQLKESFSQNISAYELRKETAIERLDAKYDIMKKQFAAYDLLINRFNSTSSMFTQISNAQIAARNN